MQANEPLPLLWKTLLELDLLGVSVMQLLVKQDLDLFSNPKAGVSLSLVSNFCKVNLKRQIQIPA